jgi:protein TonB
MSAHTLLQQPHRSFDRRVTWIALCIAGALHVGVLCMPLPSMPTTLAPEPDEKLPIELQKLPLPPPPPPERPPVTPTPAIRRIPLPVTEPPDLEPLVEPATAPPVETTTESYPDWVDYELPVAPPESPGPRNAEDVDVEPPVALPGRAQPVYPEIPRIAKIEGRVALRAVISESGDVVSIEVLRAPQPDAGFSAAAIEAVSTWKYRPARYRGRPVAVYMTVFVEFKLH